MPRSTARTHSHKRKKKILKQAKGYRGGRSKLIRTASEAVDKSLGYAYRDRRQLKREMRRLWITRINAAVRPHGLSYSRFMNQLAQADVQIDRKALAALAIQDPQGFSQLVQQISA